MKDTLTYWMILYKKRFTYYCQQELMKMNMTYGQLFIVIYIGKHENCSPKELGEALHLDAGHVNRTLHKLIENGFIIQKKNPLDKRANILKLTDQGYEAFCRSYQMFFEFDDIMLEKLDDEERQLLIQLLKKAGYKNENDE